ncbi:MAG TPA: calcium-binding protein, partial [Solirubrobacterales bacterium]|nr:calcium-binding protein [Solirubrobacterales bacterium]
CLALIWSPAAEAKPSCAGKPATIVSNAAKITGSKGHDVIVAGAGDNAIYGEGGNDTICGGEGNDAIFGGRGNDDLFGEGGNDELNGERGSDDLDGGAGTDRLIGATGNDEMDGGGGDSDQVLGGPGDDSLSGGEGDLDVLEGGPGIDSIDGGPGAHDIASYAGTGGAVNVDLGAGTVSGAEGEHLSGIEDAIGGSGDDTLNGASGTENRLDGGPGDDHLVAAGSGDEAFGGPGSDNCEGSFAAEASCGSMQGALGTAVERYRSIDGSTSLVITGKEDVDAVAVDYGGGTYTIRPEPGGNEVVLGDETSDSCVHAISASWITCQGPVSTIIASLGGGNDSLAVAASVPAGVAVIADGGKGSDTILGGPGDDTLYSGEDHDPDTLEGGGGDDVLYGLNIFHPRKDSGAAKMTGGPGDDLLIGGQPCDGDLFDGGPGDNDSASFARVNNSGVFVQATINGPVSDPDVGGCNAGHIDGSVEKIEGSPGKDILTGDNGPNTLLGRGGDDRLDGQGAFDDCVGGAGDNQLVNCEYANEGARSKHKRSPRRRVAIFHRSAAQR